MKTYNYKISQATSVIFFPSQRIKTKKHILKILLETVRIMLVENSDENLKEQNSYFKVVIDKMSRNGTPSFTHNVMVIWGCFQLIFFKRQLVELGFKHWSLRLTN
jgi:hypothetical protein